MKKYKRSLFLTALLCLAMLAAGCGGTEETEEPAAEEIATVEEENTAEAAYMDFMRSGWLDRFLAGHDTWGSMESTPGMTPEEPYYLICDIDGDGSEELIVTRYDGGCCSQNCVFGYDAAAGSVEVIPWAAAQGGTAPFEISYSGISYAPEHSAVFFHREHIGMGGEEVTFYTIENGVLSPAFTVGNGFDTEGNYACYVVTDGSRRDISETEYEDYDLHRGSSDFRAVPRSDGSAVKVGTAEKGTAAGAYLTDYLRMSTEDLLDVWGHDCTIEGGAPGTYAPRFISYSDNRFPGSFEVPYEGCEVDKVLSIHLRNRDAADAFMILPGLSTDMTMPELLASDYRADSIENEDGSVDCYVRTEPDNRGITMICFDWDEGTDPAVSPADYVTIFWGL